ncbi:glycosyltransferase [Ancylobacter oerskovii]|uniref:Glycosyltransferase n=1 Tax=Ancylobacter oerskovii TaxID=459519 RepID=A0ABW4YZH2_9HYPH|nr:glycosyltransferase family 2 protein [Ancylobacter oerskovii]MBS7543928.1 glycosyltransferase [Ancylobacter oerskovii]
MTGDPRLLAASAQDSPGAFTDRRVYALPRALLAPFLAPRQRLEFLLAVGVWAAAFLFFWTWWLDPAHVDGLGRFAFASLPFAWLTLMPVYFFSIFIGSRKPAGLTRLPPGSRVAMVVTKAPSEPFEVVAQTLGAMLAQPYPHDTWLADEDPSDETLAWCARRGVRVSTRRGVAAYQRQEWPRRTRCKEGNLAYFYDHYGYELYDFVVQMDADHVPTRDYLERMLAPFGDPAVGYVSAPSICDRNAGHSWSARARLYAEASMHGPLQAGYTGGWAPLCIGSHYGVRTAALKEIGGLGPELAEDHSTTLMMNAQGWRGVHAIEAFAHGDGPCTFADLATQEFQWSRSLVTILLRYSPQLLPRLPGRLRFQFLFCQFWYPLYSGIWALLFLMPAVALATGEPFANVTYIDFVVHYAPMSVVLLLMVWRWRANGWLRPVDSRLMSWEEILFVLAKWPWSLLGTLYALRDWMTGSFVDFRVTPKGKGGVAPVPLRVLAPYAAISALSAAAALVFGDAGSASGFYVFAIVNALLYALLVAVILVRHRLENPPRDRACRRGAGLAGLNAGLAVGLFALPLAAAVQRGPEGLGALAWGAMPLAYTETVFSVTGAGMGRGVYRLVFVPPWIDRQEPPAKPPLERLSPAGPPAGAPRPGRPE